ncbi:hypothetical protein QJQ45_016566 [Haematococcus lacustris]|nr:hypothetical protein QJQ45_016566 [Haematococcus lacustris]
MSVSLRYRALAILLALSAWHSIGTRASEVEQTFSGLPSGNGTILRRRLQQGSFTCPDDGWFSWSYKADGTRTGCCKAGTVGQCPSASCMGENSLTQLSSPTVCGRNSDTISYDSSSGLITCTQPDTQLSVSCQLYNAGCNARNGGTYCLGSVSKTNSGAADVAFYGKSCVTLGGTAAFRICSSPANPPAITMSCIQSSTPSFKVSWTPPNGVQLQSLQVTAVDGNVCDTLSSSSMGGGSGSKSYSGSCGSTNLPSNGGFVVAAQASYTLSPLDDNAVPGDSGQFLAWAQQIACQASPGSSSSAAPASSSSSTSPLTPAVQASGQASPSPNSSGGSSGDPSSKQLSSSSSSPSSGSGSCSSASASSSGTGIIQAMASSDAGALAKALLVAIAQACGTSGPVVTAVAMSLSQSGSATGVFRQAVAQAYAQSSAGMALTLARAVASAQAQSNVNSAAAIVVDAITAGGEESQAFAAGLAVGIKQLGLPAVGQIVAVAQSLASTQGNGLLLAQALAAAQVAQSSWPSSPGASQSAPPGGGPVPASPLPRKIAPAASGAPASGNTNGSGMTPEEERMTSQAMSDVSLVQLVQALAAALLTLDAPEAAVAAVPWPPAYNTMLYEGGAMSLLQQAKTFLPIKSARRI